MGYLLSQTNLTYKMKHLFTLILLCIGFHAGSQTLTVYVKAGNVPLQGVTVIYTCDWKANLGGWTTYNSANTDANGKIVSTKGANLSNVTVSVGNIPWALQQQYGSTVYPATFTFSSLTSDTTLEFNTQQNSPVITISKPNASSLSIPFGSACDLSAAVSIAAPATISNVKFEIAGKTIAGVLATGTTYNLETTWTPLAADYYKTHTLKVTAVSSSGTSTSASYDFYLGCSASCPNMLPKLSLTAPANLTINQVSGFAPVTLTATVTDGDGTIASVNLNIQGVSHAMTSTGNNKYSYTFTPSAYTSYPFTITASDNSAGTSTISNTIIISNSTFTPLPKNVVVGYWHSWNNASAPFMYLKDLIGTKYNVVNYSFIETKLADGYTPVLTTYEEGYLTNGSFDPLLLKKDIKSLKDAGIPVLASIGGQNGHVVLNTADQKNIFVQGIISLVEQYGFDGLDLDYEGGSMNFGAGSIPDFSYATISNGKYPKLKYMIDAIKEIKAHFGSGFHITAAPEVYYVQVGHGVYSDIAGSFLPVLDNLRNELDYLHVQLYNTGSVSALDQKAYSQATPDFIVSMCDMLLKGFNVSSTGIHFNALAQEQVVVGLPSCPAAAPAGGYTTPAQVKKALDYLTKGISFGGTYNLGNAKYPNFRGAMTWSVNWDKTPNCGAAYEFADYMGAYFNPLVTSAPEFKAGKEITVYPTLSQGNIYVNGINEKSIINVYNTIGMLVKTETVHSQSAVLNIAEQPGGMYYVVVYSTEAKTTSKIMLVKE